MNENKNLETIYAHAAAVAAQAAGYIVAFVPSFGHVEQGAIAVGGIVLSGLILLSHAIRRTA